MNWWPKKIDEEYVNIYIDVWLHRIQCVLYSIVYTRYGAIRYRKKQKYFLNITAWKNYSWLNEPQIWIDFTHQNGLRSVSINNSPLNIQRCWFLPCNIPLIWSIVFRFCADRLLKAFIGFHLPLFSVSFRIH